MEEKVAYVDSIELDTECEDTNWKIEKLENKIKELEKKNEMISNSYHEQLSETFKYKNAFKALVEEISKM